MEYINIFMNDIVPTQYQDKFTYDGEYIRLSNSISEELKSNIVNSVFDNSIRYYNEKNIWIYDFVETTGLLMNPYIFTMKM